MMGWDEFTADLPRHGKPGIATATYKPRIYGTVVPVNAITYYHSTDGRRDGLLVGVLFHYPQGTPFERPGQANVMVDPLFRRRGIGRMLVEAAIRDFGLDLAVQSYTDDGALLRIALTGG